MEITFDPDKHVYRVDGKVYPSVTKIISEVLKGEQEYREPSEAQKKGTIIHKTLEYLDKGILGEYDQRLQPYIEAWDKFKQETKVEFDSIENIEYNHTLGLCGMIDRVCIINKEWWIIDIKSGKSYKDYPLQTAGYKLLLATENVRRACVYFEGSNYILEEHTNPQDEITFKALLQVWKYRKNKL